MDLDRLAVLVAFAKNGTTAKAAQALHFSQPTVSHHLKRLEAETGAVLLRRVGRGLELTREGAQLAARAEEVLGLMSLAERELDAAVSLSTGHVRLAIFPSAMATLAPRIVTNTAADHPGLTLDIVEAEPPEAERLLLEGEVDLAVTFTYPNFTCADTINSEVIGSDPLYLVTPASDSLEGDLPITPSALAQWSAHQWLAGCERCRGNLVHTCESAGFTPHIRFASDDYVAMQALVAVGHGVTMLPALALAAHRHPGVRVSRVEGSARDIRLLSLGKPPLPRAFDATAEVICRVVDAVLPSES